MSIETRKIAFVKDFLNINNEQVLCALEELLHKKREDISESHLKPMSEKQYKIEMERAIEDEKNGRLIEVDYLKRQIQEWD